MRETAGVIRMGVREQDRAWTQGLEAAAPVLATIDHHARTTVQDHQCAVSTVPACPRLCIAARA